MKCGKCGSENVSVQAVSITKTKGHGLMWWLFVGWWIWILWIIMFLPMLIIKMVKGKKVTTKIRNMAVCQDCGKSWKA